MPQRAMSVFQAILGLFLVAGLLAIGLDLYRSARTGPRWKRQWIIAALFLLTSLGVVSADSARTKGLEDSAEWRQVTAVWREAEDIGSGKLGDYPFDEKGKKRVLDSLAAADANVGALLKNGLISEAEAGLVKQDLAVLVTSVQVKRPTEMRMATCYRPMTILPGSDSIGRLSAQLPLLEKLATQEKLDPLVVIRVLETVERDIAVLEKKENLVGPGRPDPAQVEKVRDAAKDRVKKIRAQLSRTAGSLEDSAEWKSITETWHEAEDIASGRRGDYPFDQKGQKRVLDSLATADTNVGALLKSGLISEAEAGLLKQDLALLVAGVQSKRPTEMRMATCYETMAFVPARDSMDRLSARLPLLEKLAAQDKFDPPVVVRVLETIERDITVLDKKENLEGFGHPDPAQVEKVRDTAREQVKKIRAHLSRASGSLEESADWKIVTEAWRAAAPLAASGKSATAERDAAKKQLDAARDAAKQLATAGLLSAAETDLLCSEATRLQAEIFRNPPTDSKVTCYVMAYLPPAQQSLDRLSQRLPLLKKLAAQGKVQPAALQKVIGSIEADLATLSDPAAVAKLEPDKRAAAEETRKRVEAALVEIRKIVGEAK